jgi:hypothetical protein
VTFSHDTELSLLVVVDLVNTAAETGGTETLPDADALRSWVDKHHVSSVAASDYSDVASIHKVRERFRQCFGLADAELLAERVNTLVAEAPVQPRLTDHNGYDWHIHYFAPGASLADHLAVDGGMALAHVVAARRGRAATGLRGAGLRGGPARPVTQPVEAVLRRPDLRQPAQRRRVPRAQALRRRRLRSGAPLWGSRSAGVRRCQPSRRGND